ncbi:conserved hypothetical protein [Tistlia consotensis]|uniref:2OG-Fe(II) oxygenase n=1 Tax=Tistlia consotensis USBA 355 TaxID=560819 RepID=A0A1Y6CRZ9_9PROT|nr:TIGR02466 family protein [Tistlia consotensis]SMF83760.1 conserved hypothetical protein [Tistlia consotensis USBA 355]SNS34294.1 conserved hypothetical protein [Tistlia consotensis]
MSDLPDPTRSGAAPADAQQGGTRAEVLQVFATPIAIAHLGLPERVNRELAETILAREAARPTTEHSNLGGWQSSWDLPDWGGPAAAAVIDAGKALAGKLTCDRQGRALKLDWKVNAWANVNRSGHANEAHTHPGAFWSGSYYVDDGGIGSDPSLGGEFELRDPRGVAPAMYAPQLAFAAPGGLSIGAAETIPPKAGMLILFPSWLQHGVRPYCGRATRISLAFNLSL